jgi:hypothetical protein
MLEATMRLQFVLPVKRFLASVPGALVCSLSKMLVTDVSSQYSLESESPMAEGTTRSL